jgi:hypothetical protein
MKDSFSLSPTPIGEDCAQLGTSTYYEDAKLECKAFIAQLRRKFGPEPSGCRLFIKTNPHDFGSYFDVNVEFDQNSEEANEYAYLVEADLPEYWDEEARVFLTKCGYSLALVS